MPALEAAISTNVQAWNTNLQKRFGRDGWNGTGGAVDVELNPRSQGASWVDGVLYAGGAGASRDVISHEMTHGLLYSLAPKADFVGRNSALGEAWADALTVLQHPDDWRIRTNMSPDSGPEDVVRDLAHPKISTISEAMRTTAVHDASGPIGLVAVRLAGTIGADRTTDIWYEAIPYFNSYLAKYASMEQLKGDQLELDRWIEAQGGGFGAAYRATMNASKAHGPEVTAAVRDAWKSVGMLANASHG